MVILLIRGSILEVIGYRNAPPHRNPCVVLLALFFDFEKMTFLEISDMYFV